MAVNGQTVDLETINDLLARLSNEVSQCVRALYSPSHLTPTCGHVLIFD